MLEMLTKLGLSDKEARVYLAALELGKDTVQNIANKAKINRATTYVVLEKLLKLGLVSTHQEEKKTVFIAEDPRELENIINQELQDIARRKLMFEESLNEFLAIYNSKADKPSVRYFEGADGLEALDRYGYDRFQEGTESLSIIPIDILEEDFPKRRRQAVEERVRRGFKSRAIYTHRMGEVPPPINSEELREAIYIPRDQLPIDATIQILPEWGVKFFNFHNRNYFGVLIQNPDLARNMKELFELAWFGAKMRAIENGQSKN